MSSNHMTQMDAKTLAGSMLVLTLVASTTTATAEQAVEAGASFQYYNQPAIGDGDCSGDPCLAKTGSNATMAYEEEAMDLERGTIYEESLIGFPLSADFYFAYNADTKNHIRLFQLLPAKIAFLDATPFDKVSCTNLARGLVFTQDEIDEPLDGDDTVLIMTCNGNLYKIGNAVDNGDGTVTIDYELLECGPDTGGATAPGFGTNS